MVGHGNGSNRNRSVPIACRNLGSNPNVLTFFKLFKTKKMFNSKKTTLFDSKSTVKKTSVTISNAFVNAGMKKAAKTTSLGNGAVKFETTGNDFIDQFGKLTQYRAPRSYQEIDKDMRLLWGQNPEMTLKLSFFTRLITRKVQLWDGSKTNEVQRGQGLKHEGIVRMVWVAINHPDAFWLNIQAFISVGSWKDIFQMLAFDLEYNGWSGRKLNWNKFGNLILAGLENENSINLVKKYLPQIKSNSQCKTLTSQADNMIAKWVCSLVFGNKDGGSSYKQYRKLKTSGTAHEWQKLISKKLFDSINFDSVHGRALMQLVSGKFISNNGLEDRYEKWIAEKPIAKFTGYPYELLQPVKSGYDNNLKLKKYQIDTINAQFKQLVETAKAGMETKTGFIVVGDTSSSMTSSVTGLKVSAYDVMKSLALFFSELLEGHFKNTWIEFNTKAVMHTWKGSTPVEKLQNDRSESYGSTNFQGVADLFVTILKTGVNESEFPTGIICLSDGCFDSTGTNKTNRKEFLKRLKNGGFSDTFVDNFKIVLWDIPNGYYGKPQTAFETYGDAPNMFYMSGLDGSTVSFLLGGGKSESTPKTANELFLAAMDQEVLNMVRI